MTVLNQFDLKRKPLVLVTSSKTPTLNKTLLAMLYKKKVDFFHIEINSEEGFNQLSADMQSLRISTDTNPNLTPLLINPVDYDSQNQQLDHFIDTVSAVNKSLVISYIDERIAGDSLYPNNLTIWGEKDDSSIEPGAKAMLNVHIKHIDEIFGEMFEKYALGFLSLRSTAETKEKYEAMMKESLIKRSKNHVDDSEYALSNNLGILDMHYIPILHFITKINNTFLDDPELAKIKAYFDQIMKLPLFKTVFNHEPDKVF